VSLEKEAYVLGSLPGRKSYADRWQVSRHCNVVTYAMSRMIKEAAAAYRTSTVYACCTGASELAGGQDT
jgi:hypothetical protein